jgi:ribose transport system ATP-binding protein
MDNILEMKGITKRFPGVLALDNVDFNVRKGEVHALVGENGAGKSTLMKILAGAIMRDGGEILFDGRPVDIRHPLDAQKLGISIIYQEFNLVPHLSVAENLFLGHLKQNAGGFVDWRQMRRSARELLKKLGLEIDVRKPVARLGVAHQQLIEIARALSIDARLIIMDEPTAALSTEEIERMFAVVKQLRDQGVSVIFITHHIKEIFEIADMATVIRDGVRVGVCDVKSLSETELVQLMIGRSLKDTGACKVCEIGQTVLSVRNLKRGTVLNDISFDLRAGEILGLAGLMGSGRTELVRAIFGADPIDNGEILVGGKRVAIRSPRDAIRAGLGLAPEDRKNQGLVLILPVVKNVTLSFIRRLLNPLGIHFGRERTIVQGLIQKLDVRTPSLGQRVVNLSGGNQQKIVLCKLLGSGARVYLLDEPTRGIDIGAKEMIYQLIRQFIDEGAAVVLISSDLEEVLQMSDRILAMHLGRITGEFQKAEFDMERILLCAMGKTMNGNGSGRTTAAELA